MVRIGVISDTHIFTNENLPKKLLDDFEHVDLVLHAGDLVNLSVLEQLKKVAPTVKAVWGNMDPPEVRRALPDKEIITINQFRFGLTHGLGTPSNLITTVREKFKEERLDCIVFGHSHLPFNEIIQSVLYFNPGSPIDRFFAPYNSYGILEVDKKIIGKIIKI